MPSDLLAVEAAGVPHEKLVFEPTALSIEKSNLSSNPVRPPLWWPRVAARGFRFPIPFSEVGGEIVNRLEQVRRVIP